MSWFRYFNSWWIGKLPGWREGIIWTAEEPPPITATALPLKLYPLSQLALCMSFPLKVSNPWIFGYFHELWIKHHVSHIAFTPMSSKPPHILQLMLWDEGGPTLELQNRSPVSRNDLGIWNRLVVGQSDPRLHAPRSTSQSLSYARTSHISQAQTW